MESKSENNIATLTHLSSLTQYFIPFGNYIFPIVLWSAKKNESEYVDYHGKQVLNFQLSLLVYTIVLVMIAVPAFVISIFKDMPMSTLLHDNNYHLENFNWEGNAVALTIGLLCILLVVGLKIAEFFLIIYASIKTSGGQQFQYPLTIPFIK